MRKLRAVVAAATASIVIGAVASMGSAGAATPTGVGTGKSSSSVLKIALGSDGSVLNLRLLGDDAQSVSDPKVAGAPSAFTRFAPLDIVSKTIPLLNLSVPGAEAKSPGGKPSVGTPVVNLTSPVSTGTINPASLTAVLDPTGAKSALSTTVSNLSLLGGVVDVPSITNGLTTDALTSVSDGLRGLKIDSINVLNLGSLLKGLGLNVANLPLGTVSNLLGALKLGTPGLATGVSLQSAVTTLNQTIDSVQALLTTAGTTVDNTVNGTVSTLLGTVNGLLGTVGNSSGLQPISVPTAPIVGSVISSLNATIDGLQKTLSDLLGNALKTLDSASLLSVRDIQAGLTAKAADTVANSVAGVTAKIGSLSVGGIDIPGLDLGATLTQVGSLVNTVTGTVSNVLGTINPALKDLVSIKVLDQNKAVTTSGGIVHSLAGITVLKASIKPPADLANLLGTITSVTNSVGSLITGLGGTVPVLAPVMTTLQGTLNGVTSLLSGGLSVTVGELTSAADFAPKAAVTPAPPAGGAELPRTGGDNAPMAVAGVLLIAMAFGVTRWLRRPVAEI